ncbi:hypothetical protein E4U41_005588 [Claviceps citrina]|nr:hypothetical protein E4U41_005588 [Claviceps citrina]
MVFVEEALTKSGSRAEFQGLVEVKVDVGVKVKVDVGVKAKVKVNAKSRFVCPTPHPSIAISEIQEREQYPWLVRWSTMAPVKCTLLALRKCWGRRDAKIWILPTKVGT